MKIEREDFMEFSAQVKNTLEIVAVDVVDRTIRLMDKRIDLIVKRKEKILTSYVLFDVYNYFYSM